LTYEEEEPLSWTTSLSLQQTIPNYKQTVKKLQAMFSNRASCLWKLLSFVPLLVLANSYQLVSNADANNFFSQYDFVPSFADGNGVRDYTNGFVNYVNQTFAAESGLAKVSNGKIRLGVDTKTVLDPSLPVYNSKYGRNSVRVQSKSTFDSGLLILDFSHMPREDCGTWAAFWTINNVCLPSETLQEIKLNRFQNADESSSTNPTLYAEIDVAEGVNKQSRNVVSLHTDKRMSCSFTSNSGQTGQRGETSCRLGDASGFGCEVDGPESTYGMIGTISTAGNSY
jgi:hypothetical protein